MLARVRLEPRAMRALWAFAISAAVVMAVTHAWVVDDAYITMRCVDNFVHGLGLRWNPDERVQVFTHPLWMFLLSAVYVVTHEVFFTLIVFSFVVSVAAVWVGYRFLCVMHPEPDERWRPLLLVLLLVSSKAFMDYSSSGLENPLTHLLMVVFLWMYLARKEPWGEADARAVFRLFFVGGLMVFNREDTALLVFPACCLVLFQQLKQKGARPLIPVTLGVSPVVLWMLFSLWYYGTIVPNTAYAKLIGPHLTHTEALHVGVRYFKLSFLLDYATLPMTALALVLAATLGDARVRSIALGAVLYLGYVLVAAAVGTHMSGRFFSPVAFIAALLICHLIARPGWGPAVALASFAVLLLSPYSPARVGTSAYGDSRARFSGERVIDTRYFVEAQGAALLNWRPGVRMPDNDWYREGKAFRDAPERVHIGGLGNALAVGYSGFAVGPSKHLIDFLGLADPLLARLPIPIDDHHWGPGHFLRAMPDGYFESIQAGDNRVTDPDLHALYDIIFEVTRAPLFSTDRLRAIARLNGPEATRLVTAYAARHNLRPP